MWVQKAALRYGVTTRRLAQFVVSLVLGRHRVCVSVGALTALTETVAGTLL
jgi:hypothetical protein